MWARPADRESLEDQPACPTLPQREQAYRPALLDPTAPRQAPTTPSVLMNSHAPAADPKSNPNPPPSASPRGPDWWLMMKAFWKKGRSIASFAPSSRFMARKVVNGIDFDSARCIVELGAGTGPITAELVKRVKPHTKLLVIELDPDLCSRLKARFPQVDVVQGDACQFDKLLTDRGFTQVDHV